MTADVITVFAGGSAVALQGSIDTFALDDVLRLVASTGKTGGSASSAAGARVSWSCATASSSTAP